MNNKHAHTCKFCGDALEVDDEYMIDTYGASWTYMPQTEWTWYCPGCEEVGIHDEICNQKISNPELISV